MDGLSRVRQKWVSMGCIVAMATLMAACADDDKFSSSRADQLTFSVDTVRLDTTFSNVPTATSSFWVYNRTGKGIRCSTVRLAQGNQTGYRVNVDGSYLGDVAGYQAQDVEIRKGDSIRVFVELTSHSQGADAPQLVEDNLLFCLESGVEQKVNLHAYSWDALLLRNKRVREDEVLQSAQPVVVYGGIRVDSLATLTIGAGTQLYFHENAGLSVYGRLRVLGEKGKEVVMRGDRLDRMFSYLPYDRTPGQWQGIELKSSSYDNEIQYADIHGAYDGIRVDSSDVSRQKLLLENATVHNCQGDGVHLEYAKAQLYNAQITNALQNPLYVHGGDVEVNGCTIAQFYSFDGNRAAAIGLQSPLARLEVRNSLITGYHDREVVWTEPKANESLHLLFDYCVLRMPQQTSSDNQKFTNIEYEDVKDTEQYGEKHFRLVDAEQHQFDFRLQKGSAAIGKGDPATSMPTDRNGLPRKGKPSVGCYELED